jgi:beta-hydroxylase
MPVGKLIAWAIRIAVLGAIIYFLPWVALIWLVCGLYDVMRHKSGGLELLQQYFFGNGILTWLFSPLNVFFDLISARNPVVYTLEDFPEKQQREIRDMLAVFDAGKDEIVTDIGKQMEGQRRGMVFFKWYDKNNDTSIPEFVRDFDTIKTIGVSVFNARESTTRHFGPVRLTVRLLYNLTPRKSENIYIEAGGVKHYWHDNPLYIFDDTIRHISVNGEDWQRFVVFVDVLRPSRFRALQNVLLVILSKFEQVNGIFYGRWTKMKLGAKSEAAKP